MTPGQAQLLELDGLGYITAILHGDVPQAPMAELLGFDLTEVEEGRVVFAGDPGRAPLQPAQQRPRRPRDDDAGLGGGRRRPHTLLRGQLYSTLETKVNMVRAITADTGRIVAEGRVLHRGSRVASAEATLACAESGRLLAHATSTCLIVGERRPNKPWRKARRRGTLRAVRARLGIAGIVAAGALASPVPAQADHHEVKIAEVSAGGVAHSRTRSTSSCR